MLTARIKNKKMLVGGALTKLIEVVFELAIPILMGRMLARITTDGSYFNGGILLLLMLSFAFFGYISTVISHKMISIVSMEYAASLREALFVHINKLEVSKTAQFSQTTLLNRINSDTSQSANGLALGLRIASRAPFLMIGSLVMLAFININLMLILLGAIVVVIFTTIIIARFTYRKFKTIQNDTDDLSLIVKENIEGARIVKAYVMGAKEKERYEKQNSKLEKEFTILGLASSLSTPLTALVINLVLVLMILVSVNYINANKMDVESLIAVVNYTTSLVIAVIATLNLMVTYARSMAANARIKEVLSIELDDEKSITDETKVKLTHPFTLEFSDVTYQYPNHIEPVLKNLNFKIKSNEKLGVVGLTASGKSTLLRLMAGLITPTSGKVLINGIDLSTIPGDELNKLVRYISQEAMFLETSVKDNLLMGREYADEEILNSLEISNFKMNEKQLTQRVYPGGKNFSGGQRQRMAIARGIIDKVPVCIFDDTFSALDYQTDLLINKNLEKYFENKENIIIVAAQRLATIKDANLILLLDENEIAYQGSHQKLIKESTLYKNIYEYQQAKEVI